LLSFHVICKRFNMKILTLSSYLSQKTMHKKIINIFRPPSQKALTFSSQTSRIFTKNSNYKRLWSNPWSDIGASCMSSTKGHLCLCHLAWRNCIMFRSITHILFSGCVNAVSVGNVFFPTHVHRTYMGAYPYWLNWPLVKKN